jgi:hypothetical protein
MTRDWKDQAETFCRGKGAEKIIHPNKKYLYDLKGLGDDVTVALFDDDGFLIVRKGDLIDHWGPGYFPGGIKAFENYTSKTNLENTAKPTRGREGLSLAPVPPSERAGGYQRRSRLPRGGS